MFRPLELTRLMTIGSRLPITTTPASVGLDFEDVEFTATDGLDIKGWFIPAESAGEATPAPTVVFVHGWLWNRVGNVAGRVPFTDRDVDFLPSVMALHDSGFSVLLFDLCNHGESGSRPPITFGAWETRDFLGAMAYLRTRSDVDPARIGAVGLSMGGNTVLLGAPYSQPIKALLVIQPTRAGQFTAKFASDQMGRLGATMVRPVDWLYVGAHAPRPSQQDPSVGAALLTKTVVRYVQGTGDPWGGLPTVQAIAAATPHALPLVEYPSTGRYEGYRYVTEQAPDVAAFFEEYL